MKNLHRHLVLATALAAGLAIVPLATGPASAEESATVPTDPGFKPDTGQLNPGATEQAYSKSADVRKVPTPAESRAALRAPDDPTSSLGSEPPQPQDNAAGTGETTGARSSADLKQNRPGPIGATGQTMPAKFSQRNDILDRTPDHGLAAVTERSGPPADLSSGDGAQDSRLPKTPRRSRRRAELNVNQALNEMHPMPANVSGINGVQALDYVKTKNKVFLVAPATRTVVDEIDS